MDIAGKIISTDILLKRISFWRTMGDTIVFTNGCFDILHPGHIHLLRTCSELGDRLIVGMNSDASVKRLKGIQRPINNEMHRSTMLAAITYTDAIVSFNEDTPEQLIHVIKPDLLAKGGDWDTSKIVGGDFVKGYGGRVVSVNFLEGHSTTAIIEKTRGDNKN